MFLKALGCPEVRTKAMMNLALVYQTKASTLAAGGDLTKAKDAITNAAKYLDEAKPLLDQAVASAAVSSASSSSSSSDDGEVQKYAAQFAPLRLQCHRLAGSVFAGLKDFESCEKEFLAATRDFPNVPGAWQMLARVLDIQGKTEEALKVREKLQSLQALGGGGFG